MTQDAFDLFTWPTDALPDDRLIIAEEAVGSRIVSMEVELPHPEADLISVWPFHDGRYRVTLRDHFGVGPESIFTGWGVDPLSASRSIGEDLLAAIEKRREKDRVLSEALQARRAALGAGGTYPSGRSLRPAGDARRGHPPESQTVTGAYTGSVPRNALVWDVSPRDVRVQLKSGLVWADWGNADERIFPTIRQAKDHTRGAIPG